MNGTILIIVAILFTCMVLNKLSAKVGVPVLLLFIVLGILMGWKNPDVMDDYEQIETVCSTALIFIIFYGGFGTKWSTAKPVAVEAGLLATVGVIVTAGLTGLFCHYCLHWRWFSSFFLGSVISSTDAASVFSILRTKKMGLKNNAAPMLELESGSNDPCSYLLTIVFISILKGQAVGAKVVWMVLAQLGFGALFGVMIAQAVIWVMHRVNLSSGFGTIFFVAVALLAYALPSVAGGNGYLSAYIVGIMLGNHSMKNRKEMMNFFDGLTSFAQIVIFYLLGLMTIPGNLLKAFLPALFIFLFITIIGRPAAVMSILTPFKKYSFKNMCFISAVGLRGAASIVFAILTINPEVTMYHDAFSIVVCIVLLSMSFQGASIPLMAKAFDMIDHNEDVMKTFNDFSESEDISFGVITINETDNWNGKLIKELLLPSGFQITMLIRGENRMVAKGQTRLQAGDKVIICSPSVPEEETASLTEHPLSKNSKWAGKTVKEYPYKDGRFLVMIKRGEEHIIPNGKTVLHEGDILYILNQQIQL